MTNQQPSMPNQHQNYQTSPASSRDTSVITTGDWMVTLLIMIIPVINIIMLFVWAFSGGTNLNKSNWAKANLIWFAIILFIYLIIFAIVGAAFLP